MKFVLLRCLELTQSQANPKPPNGSNTMHIYLPLSRSTKWFPWLAGDLPLSGDWRTQFFLPSTSSFPRPCLLGSSYLFASSYRGRKAMGDGQGRFLWFRMEVDTFLTHTNGWNSSALVHNCEGSLEIGSSHAQEDTDLRPTNNPGHWGTELSWERNLRDK